MRYLWVLSLLCLMACGRVEEAVAPPDPNLGQVGETVVLHTEREFTVVIKNWGDFDRSIGAMNPTQLQSEEKRGVLYLVDEGTKVKVTEVKSYKGDRDVRGVEVLEGKFKGKTGYVSNEWIKKL